MDKPIAKKPVYYRYRWHIAGGIAFIVLLVYVGIAASGGRKLRTDAENLIIGEATSDKFLEYVDVEGVVQPILTIQINTREAGSVDRIIAEEGTMMNKGDTILTLNNPDLIRAIEDQQDEWEKQLISYQEKEIEMEQKSIDLQQKTLQTTYELNRLKKSYALDEEEFNMGVKSKAQLEVARDEFDYKTRSTALQLEGLRHDSAATILRRELMKNDLERERKKFERARERMEDLGNKRDEFTRKKGLSRVKQQLVLLWDYLSAVTSGRYKGYSMWAYLKVVACLLYVVSPFDLVPDFFPWVGWLDDIAVVIYVCGLVKEELDQFSVWQARQHLSTEY